MPISMNRVYSDLDRGFANLGKLFAPPDPADLANAALARSRDEDAARRRALFSIAQESGLDQNLFDRMNIAAGLYAPNVGYYGVDQGNATSRANNAADNARILEEQRLKNDAAMREAILGAATAPVAQGAARPGFNPADYGAPAIPAVPEFAGPTAPLSETQQKAAERQDMIAQGKFTPEMIMDAILGANTPVQAIGPDGKPAYMSPGAAVRTGAQPVPTGAEAARKDAVALINGQTVPVTRAPSGLAWQTADGQPIPPDASVFDLPRAQGSAAEIGMGKPTEASDRAGIFYNRAAPASQNINSALASGYIPSDADYEFTLGALSGAPNAVANRLVTDQGRKFYNDAQNFMMAVLRPDTGAAFGKEEFQSYARVFIPLPGDDPATVQAKAEARAVALAALHGTSRGSAEQIARILASQGLPVPPEMQAVIARGGVATGAAPSVAPPAGAPSAAPVAPPAAQGAPSGMPRPPSPPSPPSPPVPPGVDPDAWQYMTPEERALWQN